MHHDPFAAVHDVVVEGDAQGPFVPGAIESPEQHLETLAHVVFLSGNEAQKNGGKYLSPAHPRLRDVACLSPV